MDARSESIAKRFEIPVLVAALLVVPVIAVEQSGAGDPWRTIAEVLNWCIWITFVTELVVLLAVVPDRRAWLRSHPLEVIVVVLTPPFLPSSLQAARLLRLLRLLRLIRVAQLARRLFSLEGLRWAALLAMMTALGGGAAFAYVEGEELSTWDGVWWAVTTMTTVGDGKLFPTTTASRIIAIGVMAVGISFIAMLTAALAERFLSSEVRDEADEIAAEVDEVQASVVRELQAISSRLSELELALERKPPN